MRAPTVLALAMSASVLLGGGVAHGAPPWSAPQPIAPGVQSYTRPNLAFTGDGHALALLTGDETSSSSRILVAAPGTSAFRQVGRAQLAAPPAVFGPRGVAYLRTRGRDKATVLGASIGT